MDRSADMFSQFMDRLARHMDDHRTRAGDLAAEMFVSRSLLDRLVSAAAGEPPARFRRRLLLERAACRLRAGDASVIEAAVEAGYSSGERVVVHIARAGRRERADRHRAAVSGVGHHVRNHAGGLVD